MPDEDWDNVVNMIKGPNNKKAVKLVTDIEQWDRKRASDDEFFDAKNLKKKIWG